MKHISILFVCMGNICRSPLAEGILRYLVAEAGLSGQFTVDSAGTGGWHEGEPPDRRSIATAQNHGIDISAQCPAHRDAGFQGFRSHPSHGPRERGSTRHDRAAGNGHPPLR